MRLLSARLTNFCQHRSLQFDLSPGLNAIVGSNGRGKSNALKAVYAALTNDFGRSPGPKDQNVRQGTAPRERSEVELTFEHQGATYGLVRGVKPAKHQLTVPGEERPTTGEAAVNARLAQILGVTPEILDKYVFVDQWAMFDFLVATPAERAKAFARLFGTQDAEAAWKAANDQVAAIRVPQVAADLDERRAQRGETADTLAAVRSRLADYAHLPAAPAFTADDQAVQDTRRWSHLQAEIAAGRAWMEAADNSLNRLHGERTAFDGDLANLRSALTGSTAEADAAKAAIANWRTLTQVANARSRAAAQLEAAKGEEARYRRPSKNGMYLDASAKAQAQYDVENVVAQVRAAEGLIRSFDPATGRAECPTCWTPVSALADRVETARRDLPGLKARQAELQSRLSYTAQYDREAAEYEQWRAGWEPRVAELERHVAGFQSIPRPDRTEAELAGVVARHDELVRAVRDVEVEIGRIDQEAAEFKGRRDAAAEGVRAAETEQARLRPARPEDLPAIEQRIAANLRAFQERAALQGEERVLTVQLAGLQESVGRLEAAAAEAVRAGAAAAHMTAVAAVLHRDNLPRAVARDHLRALTASTNAVLGDFLSPFSVAAEDDLSFRADFHDGRAQPAGRLSGGEKVVLALGFRLSVNSTFAPDVGLLCLDEPTVGLDEHNLGCLRTALGRLRDLSRARGLQVVLVTHERSLMPLFDKVIDLDSAP